MRKKLLITVCMILFGATLYAQTESENQLELTPTKVKEVVSEKAVVEFKTNISNVEVYLNGTFYGRTNLEIKDLLPGVYSVELSLKGYETQKFMIQAKKGLYQTYSLEMKLIQGSLTLVNVPEGAEISFDEQIFTYSYKKNNSNVITSVPGVHKLGIKCFGFENYEKEVTVEAYENVEIQVELSSAAFELSNFVALKSVCNPDYNGHLGRSEFKYNVTKNAFVIAEVYDSENQLVWTDTFRDLTTWNQRFSWNGRTTEGNPLPDGEYLVKIYSGDYEQEVTVTINRAIEYPMFSANATGSGIGPEPAVFGSQFDYCAIYLDINPTTSVNLKESSENQKSAFYGLGLNAGVIWDFKNHFEVSGQLSTTPGFPNGFLGRIGGSFKAYNSYDFNNDLKLSYGGLVRAGFATKAFYDPYLIDNGSGIGLGGLVGLSGNNWNAGFSTQVVYSPKRGKFAETEWLWKNSFTGTYKPVKNLGINGWVGFNSSISNFGINYGGGLSWLPFSSTILLNLNIDGNVIPGEANYLSVHFGLCYLF